MNLEVLKYLQDVIDSIAAIERYTSDLFTLDDYENDEETIDSVERRFRSLVKPCFKQTNATSHFQ